MEVLAIRSVLVLLFLSLAFSLVPSIQATDVKYCAKRRYEVRVDDVEISPYPVHTGKPTTFAIKADTDVPISGGKLDLDVSYFGVKVHSETDSICEKTSCPISVGKFLLSHTQTLPSFTPPGSYTLRMRMHNEENHELTCIHFNFKIGFGSDSDVSSI